MDFMQMMRSLDLLEWAVNTVRPTATRAIGRTAKLYLPESERLLHLKSNPGHVMVDGKTLEMVLGL